MNKNKLSSLTNLFRKETNFCLKICACLFWLEDSCLFLMEEIKKLLFREQTLSLLLFQNPQSAVPKKTNPPHSDLLLTLLSKYIAGENYQFMCLFQYCIHLQWFFSTENLGSHRTGMLRSQLMKYQMGLQSTVLLLSDVLFIEQVMY